MRFIAFFVLTNAITAAQPKLNGNSYCSAVLPSQWTSSVRCDGNPKVCSVSLPDGETIPCDDKAIQNMISVWNKNAPTLGLHELSRAGAMPTRIAVSFVEINIHQLVALVDMYSNIPGIERILRADNLEVEETMENVEEAIIGIPRSFVVDSGLCVKTISPIGGKQRLRELGERMVQWVRDTYKTLQDRIEGDLINPIMKALYDLKQSWEMSQALTESEKINEITNEMAKLHKDRAQTPTFLSDARNLEWLRNKLSELRGKLHKMKINEIQNLTKILTPDSAISDNLLRDRKEVEVELGEKDSYIESKHSEELLNKLKPLGLALAVTPIELNHARTEDLTRLHNTLYSLRAVLQGHIEGFSWVQSQAPVLLRFIANELGKENPKKSIFSFWNSVAAQQPSISPTQIESIEALLCPPAASSTN